MSVILGHASISEKGTINGNKGDQTGGEVTKRSYYDKAWTYVYRPLTANLAEALVIAMSNACENNNIGYGQSDRLTLYYECLRLSKNKRITPAIIAKVTNKVNCDCSSLVALCCISCGLKVNPSMSTYSEYGEIKATGSFDVIPWRNIKEAINLRSGDIIQSDGHTAIILQTDNTSASGKVTARYPAYNFDSNIAGMYTVRVSDFLAMRDGASTDKDILYKLNNSDIVYCYGYHTNEWYYVQFSTNDIVYTGFVHSKYLYKMGAK